MDFTYLFTHDEQEQLPCVESLRDFKEGVQICISIVFLTSIHLVVNKVKLTFLSITIIPIMGMCIVSSKRYLKLLFIHLTHITTEEHLLHRKLYCHFIAVLK